MCVPRSAQSRRQPLGGGGNPREPLTPPLSAKPNPQTPESAHGTVGRKRKRGMGQRMQEGDGPPPPRPGQSGTSVFIKHTHLAEEEEEEEGRKPPS